MINFPEKSLYRELLTKILLNSIFFLVLEPMKTRGTGNAVENLDYPTIILYKGPQMGGGV